MKVRFLTTKSESGNALLELLLFIPIMLLMLLAGLEVALAYAERSAIISALRAGLNSPRGGLVYGRLDSSPADLEIPEQQIDSQMSRAILERAAESIEDDLLRIRGRERHPGSDPYLIRAAFVETTFDRETGKLRDCRIIDSVERGDHGFRPTESDIGSPYIEAEDYISGVCRDSSLIVPPSGFVVPLDGSVVRKIHQPRLFQIYGEISAAVRGLNRRLVFTFLNRKFDVREQALYPLRLPGIG